MGTYTATVTREGNGWLAQCDQEPTAYTWVPTLTALRREIAYWPGYAPPAAHQPW